MSIEPLREVRDPFSDVVDRVEREHERVTVTRNGRAAAVIISPEDLAEPEETLAVWHTSVLPSSLVVRSEQVSSGLRCQCVCDPG
jgi:prevent-host-death family protein